MDEYPRALMEFERRFATEEACRVYLVRLRWPEGVRCLRCQSVRVWPATRGRSHCATCGFQTTVLAGTIFQDTKQDLRLWFRAMWYVTNQKSGVSALGLQRTLGLGSYQTAWTWLQKLRTAMVRPGRERLTEEVEVDEIYVGGVKSNRRGGRQRSQIKTLVAVAAEVRDRLMYVHQPGDCNGGPSKRLREWYDYPGRDVFASRIGTYIFGELTDGVKGESS